MNPTWAASRNDRRNQPAFTFPELLVVLTVVALLGLLSLSGWAHSQTSADRARCANNLHRLTVAWHMYSDDYSGNLIANTLGSNDKPWVSGMMDFTAGNSDNTNPLKLTNAAYAAIGPYVNSSLLFRCPADPSTLLIGGVPKLRVRSYSMNAFMGSSGSQWGPSYRAMTKMSEVSQPSRMFVFLEEHPNSINDAEFFTNPPVESLVDYPGSLHLGGANLAMADGHIEYWQWSDPRTMPPIGSQLILNVASPNNPDVARIQAAASYLK